MAAPQLTLGHYQGCSLTHLVLITVLFTFDSSVTWSLTERSLIEPSWLKDLCWVPNLAEHLVWTRNLPILSHQFNQLGHSPHEKNKTGTSSEFPMMSQSHNNTLTLSYSPNGTFRIQWNSSSVPHRKYVSYENMYNTEIIVANKS